MNIDFSKKPEGATHWAEDQRCYSTGGIQYYRQIGVEWYFWGESLAPGWNRISGPSKPVSSLEATIAKEWPGGLPPVGTVCEFSLNRGRVEWKTGTVLAHDGVFAVMKFGSEYHPRNIHGVRPIRTPEQIAAEQYERDAEELAKILAIHEPIEVLALAKLVLDCGYRKQVTP